MQADTANFCPACGQRSFNALRINEYCCSDCGYRYFHNTAAAVAAMIVVGDEVLLTQRGRDPEKGRFDFPGGFVDPDESLEAALLRELNEELQLKPSPSQLQYLFSDYNTYEYAGVTYKTADIFFLAKFDMKPKLLVCDDVAAVKWRPISAIDDDELAFDSVRRGVKKLQQLMRKGKFSRD